MKLTETVDECIKLASKELECQEFDIQNYPKILKEINERVNDNEKLDEEGLANSIECYTKRGETNILKLKEIINNLNSFKDKIELEEK
jgi:hypothetical protein